ncbi:DNA/RNA helicase domain-containing protein, partial [Acidiplasma aeolicum]|uniref:DNA/RNA helicase domain-containing protein n=1 Tax=Acidiplasma aeolicum TaxID=507754 RepID=UPI0012FC3FBB
MENAFISYYGHRPSQAEINAWNNSFQFVKNELQVNNLFDIWVIIEYELPYSAKRIDAILLGKNNDNIKNIVILELKQWSGAELSPIDGNVITYVGNALRCEPHPSIQVSGYYYYLKDFMDIFSKNCYGIYACAYCHNYSPKINDPMFSYSFHDVISKFPLFTKNDFKNFGMYLKEKLNNGGGLDVYNDFIHSSIKPSKKLIDFTSNILRNQKIFSLIDDQILANNTIIDRAKKASKLKNKSVIIVSGGPGTGKSVIALNAMAELLSMGLKVYHATGSKSFTSSLQKILSSDRVKSPQNQSAKNLFLYFNS